MNLRRLGRQALLAVTTVASGGLAIVIPGSPAGAVTLSNACINSAVPTDFSQVDVDMTATAPASVDPGDSFQLTNVSQTVALPGAIFVAGYNLGLLQVGSNTVPGTIATTIEGTNTTQGVQNTSTENISVTFTITDPDGAPGTGDETGTDATVPVAYDDMTWTAAPSGTIQFREDTVTPQSATVAGIRIVATIGGVLTVRFGCNPGTVGGTPEVITLTDPAASFATTTNTGGTEEQTTTTTSTTTTTTVATTTTTVPDVPGSRTTVNACKNSATGTYSDLPWTLSGKATFDAASNRVTVSDSRVGVSIPPTLLVAGYNLGLLHVGVNGLPTTVYVARSAIDFLGAVATQVDHFSLTVTTTITDPDGVPGTGDEAATPLVLDEPLPNMVATPAGGGVSFSQALPGTIGSVPLGTGGAPLAVGGSIFVQATVGSGATALKVNFDCFPGTTIIDPPGGTTGRTFTPASPLPFVVLSLTGAAPPPPPPAVAAPEAAVQSAANAPLARTGSGAIAIAVYALALVAAGCLAQAAARQARHLGPNGRHFAFDPSRRYRRR